MQTDSWTCLMVEKGPGIVSDEIRNALKIAACRLRLDKVTAARIVSNVCSGYIETDNSYHMVGTRGGILFKTQVSGDGGDYKVNFLLGEDDLDRGAAFLEELEEDDNSIWIREPGEIPIPELQRFLNLGSTSLN